ncbi:MAG: hypothetical protein LBG20_00090 [Holosporaceae bacterium]|jgi:hypothetical protein|nr:hypothetical protein [Holosporaceae bacterium]
MGFFSNTADLISGRRNRGVVREIPGNPEFSDQNLELDFSLRNYVSESFSVLIVRPMSGYILKAIKVTSLLAMGVSAGLLVSLLCFLVFMQFGSVENTLISAVIQEKLDKLYPDMDLSIKSATLRWNFDAKVPEVVINRVKLDNLSLPQIIILPNYTESVKQQRLIAKKVSIMNPQIHLEFSDDFNNISINPNLVKGGDNKALLEPFKSFENYRSILGDDVIVKLLNADLSISENGVNWQFKNLYCEHRMGDNFPRIVDFSMSFPGQDYVSRLSLTKSNEMGDKFSYIVKTDSLNPFFINTTFSKRNTPLDNRIFTLIDGYNLPVSGTLTLNFEGEKFREGRFDLIVSTGTIKIPSKSTLSLNLGKRIDSGSVCGTISENLATIESINITYGSSGLQLTGISVPLDGYRFLDVANVNGTLSLTNIDVREMESILPENISKLAVSMFNTYLPGFKLELLKFDLKGDIAFNEQITPEKLDIGHGIFKIKDAKVPLGKYLVTNVDATGVISNDGFDIKLAHATFQKIKINSGVFFISNKDGSWIGQINIDIPVDDISSYTRDISQRLSQLPLDQLAIKGLANLNIKLVNVKGDKLQNSEIPFRIVEGDGIIKSDNNTKELKLTWNDERLSASAHVATGKNKINFKIDENLADGSGRGKFIFDSSSDFLNAFIPVLGKICHGNYILEIDSSWKNGIENYDVRMSLKNASMVLPMVGEVKLRKEDGLFTAHVICRDEVFEFLDMSLITPNNQIKGKMVLDKKGHLLKCSFDEFKIRGGVAKINLIRDAGNNILFSVVGDSFDASKIYQILEKIDKKTMVSIYVNLKEAIIFGTQKIKNVKGNLDIKNGKIVGGACYAVIGDDTTLVLTARPIEGADDIVLSLSASDAGKFLKYFRVIDTIIGGSINFVTKSSNVSDKSMSGVFEIRDFIVKNNHQLGKLVSFSSTIVQPSVDNFSMGFNFCTGVFTMAGNRIQIENGKAVSPAMGISFSGFYDRENDYLDMNGKALATSTLLNPNMNGVVLMVPYNITGSIGMPIMCVKQLRNYSIEDVRRDFGGVLNVLLPPPVEHVIGNDRLPPRGSSTNDLFDQRAFDNKKAVKNRKTTQKSAPRQKISTDKNFGIKIVRGARSSANENEEDPVE